MAEQFRLMLRDPTETGLETFDFDSDLWTVTDAGVTVERYTGDADYPSVMYFHGGTGKLQWGDIDPATSSTYKFGATVAGSTIKFGAGSVVAELGEGVYKDYTVVAGEKVILVWLAYAVSNGAATITIYDHTNADAQVASTTFALTSQWLDIEYSFTVPANCTTIRIELTQVVWVDRPGFYADDFGFLTNAILLQPNEYQMVPDHIGAFKQSLGHKRRFDKRTTHYTFNLYWNHYNQTMYDRLKVLWDTNETLYFDDGDVPQLTETFTVYQNATYDFAGITNPSSTDTAWYDTGAALPTAAGDYEGTELSTVDYEAIDGDDTAYHQTTNPSDREYLWHKFKFVSAITGTDVQRFRVKVVASSADSSLGDYDGCVLYAWDGNGWNEIAQTTNEEANDLTYATTDSDIAQQYVDSSGNVYILLRSRAFRDGTRQLRLKTYYAEVEINDGLDINITTTHKIFLPNNTTTDVTVNNKTTGLASTEWALLRRTSTIRFSTDNGVPRDVSSGDIVEVTYYRFYEVKISSHPSTWMTVDVDDQRGRKGPHIVLQTLTGY